MPQYLIFLRNLLNHRIHQHPLEARSPVYNRNNNDVKSPLSATSARTLRRQSLTGVQPSGLDTSRRSSLGGKSTDSSE